MPSGMGGRLRSAPQPASTRITIAATNTPVSFARLDLSAYDTDKIANDYLQRYEEAGVDQVIFCSQAGKNKHEDIMESFELFGREVLPEFVERDERLQRDRGHLEVNEDPDLRTPADELLLGYNPGILH